MDNIAVLNLPSNKNWSLADFTTEEPYKALYNFHQNHSEFMYESELFKLATMASAVGFKNFKKMVRSYEDAERRSKRSMAVYNEGLLTQFDDQPLELDCGIWEAHDSGIYREGADGRRECACAHPIMPVERLVNIDTGEVKTKLAFKRPGRGKPWIYRIVSKNSISTAREITNLSSLGISVTSNSAKTLIDYLNDMENRNYDIIPERKSITRCGYIPDEGFSPFVDGLQFDGDEAFSKVFKAITSKGSETEWFDVASKCRSESVTARIVLAASFASILVNPLGCLPFFVHLWGADSGTGKTVALMLASSVWGNPALGEYTATFNSTTVGCEFMAAFLNHLPLCLDELQLTKDDRGRSKFDVYQLAQGVGRTRGSKNGGIQATPTWSNCIITTGESPLTSNSAGAGAVNRVIDIECTANNVVIKDGQKIANKLKSNYGFAGRWFVDQVYGNEKNMEMLKNAYQQLFAEMSQDDTTEKQAMAAAAICAADLFIDAMYFRSGLPPLDGEIRKFLASKKAVSIGARAYAFLCDWVSQNSAKFAACNTGEVYGIIENELVYINRSVFNVALESSGFSVQPVLSYLRAEKLIDTSGKGFTKSKRINGGVPTNCIVLHLESTTDLCDIDELPF